MVLWIREGVQAFFVESIDLRDPESTWQACDAVIHESAELHAPDSTEVQFTGTMELYDPRFDYDNPKGKLAVLFFSFMQTFD